MYSATRQYGVFGAHRISEAKAPYIYVSVHIGFPGAA